MSASTPAPVVSVVVVSYNTCDDLLRCLGALRQHVHVPVELIVVDNASADGSPEAVRRGFPEALVLESPVNAGFSRANNLGLGKARAPFVLVLNSDAEVQPGAVEALLDALEARPDVGVVGPRTRDAEGRPQVSAGPFLGPLAEWRQRRLVAGVRGRRPGALRRAEERFSREHEPDWVSGSCFMARREALAAVGGFDERFFLYEEDVDLCLRLRRASWRVLYTPRAEVVHHLGKSMAQAPARARLEYHRSHLLYYRKHRGRLLTALLAFSVALRGATGWLAALGPGASRRERRREASHLFRIALGER